MATTVRMPREKVRPGTIVKHKGHSWMASANTNGSLYLTTAYEKTRVQSDEIEVFINSFGKPLGEMV